MFFTIIAYILYINYLVPSYLRKKKPINIKLGKAARAFGFMSIVEYSILGTSLLKQEQKGVEDTEEYWLNNIFISVFILNGIYSITTLGLAITVPLQFSDIEIKHLSIMIFVGLILNSLVTAFLLILLDNRRRSLQQASHLKLS